MARKSLGTLAAWVLLAGLTTSAAAWAGGPEPCDGTGSAVVPYSRWHYWTPALYRLHARRCGPQPHFGTADRYPDLPPRFQIIRYPCPAVAPAVLAADRAVAP